MHNIRGRLLPFALLLAACVTPAQALIGNCVNLTTKYNASKTHWRVGGLAIRGAADFISRFGPTFSDFLTNEVGPCFDPPLTFEAVPLNFSSTFTLVENKGVDFIYTNPSAFSCLDSEFRVSAILTLRNFRQGNELTQFGGIVFTRSNNTDITRLEDLRGKIVEAVSISGLGAAQMQWKLMTEKGLSLMTDPAQVRFAFNQKKIVHDVRRGAADVGFVRTDMIEGMDANGETNISWFKVIDKINATLGDGTPFPFQTSTELYPEWSLGALAHADWKVVEEVSKAMMLINNTHPAAVAGTYSTWQAPISYMPLRDMQEDLGWIFKDTTTQRMKCMRSDNLYDAIVCPSGHFKLSETEVDAQCGQLGSRYACPSGYACLCRPCKQADEVEVTFDTSSAGCSKMSTCATVQQRTLTKFSIVDNRKRNLNMSYKYHVTSGTAGYAVEGVFEPKNNSYNLTLSTANMGDNVVEIFLGGEQIPSSPFLVRVQERQCPEGYKSNTEGICEETVTVEYKSEWVSGMGFTLFAINVGLSLFFLMWTFANRKNKIVIASQPFFLYLICIGCIISSTSVIFVGLDDKDYSTKQLDGTCMGAVWFYGLGYALSVSAIAAKTFRAKRIMLDNLTEKASSIQLSVASYCKYIFMALVFEIVVLGIWTATDPLRWERKCTDSRGDFCTTSGQCSSTNGVPFAIVLLGAHFLFLVYLLYLCYKVRAIPDEFSEHKWITASAISSIEILFITPFLVAMTWTNSTTTTLIITIALFFNDFGILLMIFVPKMQLLRQKHTDMSLTQEDMLFNLRRDVRATPDGTKRKSFMDVKRTSSIQMTSVSRDSPNSRSGGPISRNGASRNESSRKQTRKASSSGLSAARPKASTSGLAVSRPKASTSGLAVSRPKMRRASEIGDATTNPAVSTPKTESPIDSVSEPQPDGSSNATPLRSSRAGPRI